MNSRKSSSPDLVPNGDAGRSMSRSRVVTWNLYMASELKASASGWLRVLQSGSWFSMCVARHESGYELLSICLVNA